MTAEIAILNKSAVALATDSAVTISSGTSNDKVFDSADKLFELSCSQPIGVMIYNGMHFAGIPLPDLIKDFRAQARRYSKISDCVNDLLRFFHTEGLRAPVTEKEALLESLALPVAQTIAREIQREVNNRVFTAVQNGDTIDDLGREAAEAVIDRIEAIVETYPPGNFFGPDDPATLLDEELKQVSDIAERELLHLDDELRDRVKTIIGSLLLSGELSPGRTGIVVAGFGADELFPTLFSFEMEGVVAGKLKFNKTDECDIDRSGRRAFIKPFAQKEMVERFLYGLDSGTQAEIEDFAKRTVGTIAARLLDRIQADDQAALDELREGAKEAEDAFISNLRDVAFRAIVDRSRRSVEDMIEFMPKPEMAKMAEALVELTSMKRKVSVGLETVGGPVDVAVISRSEGFVWIKRKHYFPIELNARYVHRVHPSLPAEE